MFVKLENGIPTQWGFGEAALRGIVPASLPVRLTPEVLVPYGFGILRYTNQPASADPLLEAKEIPPVLTEDGYWLQSWELVPKFASQEDAAEFLAQRTSTSRLKKWEEIKAERDRRASLGIKVGSHWFHSDQKSRTQQLGLVLLGASIPVGLQWKTLTTTPPPVFVTMTPALAQGIVAATAASDTAIFTAAEQHRIALESSSDPENYDFSVGWPTSIEDEANEAGITFDQSLL